MKTFLFHKHFFVLTFLLAFVSTSVSFGQTFFRSFQSGDSEYPSGLAYGPDGESILVKEVVAQDGSVKVHVQMLNVGGDPVWEKRLNIKSFDDIARTADGNYVLVGTVAGATPAMAVVKMNSSGDIVMFRSVPAEATESNQMLVVATDDGGFAVVRYENYDLATSKMLGVWKQFYDNPRWDGSEPVIHLLRFDNTATLKWKKRFAEFPGGTISDVIFTSDGGYMLLGTQMYLTRYKKCVFMAKITPLGELEWQQTYARGEQLSALSLCADRDKGYVILGLVGETNSLLIQKIDLKGKKEWETMMLTHGAAGASVCLDVESGNFLCIGKTYIPDPDTKENNQSQLYLAKISATGSIVWEKNLGEKGVYYEPLALFNLNNKGFMVAATEGNYYRGKILSSSSVVIRTDKQGMVYDAAFRTD